VVSILTWILRPVLDRLDIIQRTIMTSNAEVVATIENIGAQLDKARLEVTKEFAVLTEKLEAALSGAGVADPTVVAALVALKAKSQAIDDVVADAPVEPPVDVPVDTPVDIPVDAPADPVDPT
jgi:hypothetical protein